MYDKGKDLLDMSMHPLLLYFHDKQLEDSFDIFIFRNEFSHVDNSSFILMSIVLIGINFKLFMEYGCNGSICTPASPYFICFLITVISFIIYNRLNEEKCIKIRIIMSIAIRSVC